MGLISFLGKEYLAGHSLKEGIETAELLFRRGIFRFGHPVSSTIDILGEEAKSDEDVERNVLAYLEIIKELGSLAQDTGALAKTYSVRNPFSVSFKPSAVSLSVRENDEVRIDQTLDTNVQRVIEAGMEHQIPLTIDMEDHAWTYPTLQLASRMWASGLPLDIVLQSYLHSTPDDVSSFLGGGLPTDRSSTTVRACRGIYREPAEIATQSPTEAKKRLYALVEQLFDLGYFVGIATHDIKLQKRIKEGIIEKKEIPKERYEFQGLKGVYSFEDVILPGALRNHENVRIYLPVELKQGDGNAYMRRRIVMNTEIVRNYVVDRAGRMMRRMRE